MLSLDISSSFFSTASWKVSLLSNCVVVVVGFAGVDVVGVVDDRIDKVGEIPAAGVGVGVLWRGEIESRRWCCRF